MPSCFIAAVALAVVGADSSLTILVIAVPAADPSIPLLASVARDAAVSSIETPNILEIADACFMASIISFTDVAEIAAAFANTSPIWPKSFTDRPNECIMAVADNAAFAISVSPTAASFKTEGRAVVASSTDRPAWARTLNPFAASSGVDIVPETASLNFCMSTVAPLEMALIIVN